MKTTLDLPDDLLQQAKAMALRRRTTLKAMVEHALRRELQGNQTQDTGDFFSLDEHGFPVLKKSGSTRVTSQKVHELMEDE